MRNYISKIIFVGVAVLSLISCENNNRFIIEGNVADAKDKMIYLEHVGIAGVTILDSVKLKEPGAFKFRHEHSGEPDFYRLRLGGQLINMAIDSTETIHIQADASKFAQNYTLEGSDESLKIKDLTLMQLKASIAYNNVRKSYNDGNISADQYMDQIVPILNEYKEEAKKYIYANPKSTSAYFALFQQINDMLIFDPYNKEDYYQAFGAVATSWTQYYPEAIRSKHLYNMAMQSLKSIRGERPIEYDSMQEIDHFEIRLPNINDQEISLSEVCIGKVTLVDFTAYQMKESPEHNLVLREFYEKYKLQGFEIFQISLDTDDHFWKNAAINLPWICVRDPESVYSKIAASYNVKNIPTAFVLNKASEVVKRIETFDDLEKEIGVYLK